MSRAVPQLTRKRQQDASNPEASAWVSAHAGSGKTHVLSQRVIRLLLAGVPPSRLICLTFTKAAAANMSDRVFRKLAGWTLAPDEKLRSEIVDMGEQPPDDLDVARRLFAQAVETPGGLKIQTIHAFCERVLHLFPFEANVPADFRVVEDLEREELMQAARVATMQEARRDKGLADSLALVATETRDGGFEKALGEMLGRRDLLADPETLIDRLPDALGLAPDETEAEIERRIVEDGLHWKEWGRIAGKVAQGSANDGKAAARLRAAFALAPHRDCLEHYFEFLFTKGEIRAAIATKSVEKIDATLPAALQAEAARVHALCARLLVARARSRSAAIIRLAADVLARYTADKQTRSLLDFDDLIGVTRDLLGRDGASGWVNYKLDGGVEHILVDEAQDTSAAQWDILKSLAAEFTAGAGARQSRRTFFAVGDEKQSIFSFQGAAPEKFDEMRRYFANKSRSAGLPFNPVDLDLSFRSGVNILNAVDFVFAKPAALDGLTATPDQPPQHKAFKDDVQGLVEIWPPIVAAPRQDPQEWVAPLDLPRESDPPVELARRIAARIRQMTAHGSTERIAGDRPGHMRAVTPGDVMILVRRRGAFFEAMVRALKEAGVPVAGADRLNIAQHIAVMDMLAAARVALLPEDDLSLACVLKSPLCELTDDDLIALAPRRTGSLWEALCTSQQSTHRRIAAQIGGWRALARDARPFDFFQRLLGPEGGRRRFVERMGPEASDALDELLAQALSHERQETPSLPAFVHAIESLDLTVRRDMEAAGGFVRVMTAHAAKGLEAPIVFLPDTCGVPPPGHAPVVYTLGPVSAPTLVWSSRKNDGGARVEAARTAALLAMDREYRRLLYVAMTRAEERLYVAGYCGVNGPAQGCWHNLIAAGLHDHCDEIDDPDRAGEKIRRMGAPLQGDEMAPAEAAPVVAPPDWLSRPAPAEPAPAPPLRPSSALAGADSFEPERGGEGAGARAAKRGTIVHTLLQFLPGVAPALRAPIARRFAVARAEGSPLADAEALAAEALSVLDAVDCAPLFGERSRAEVGIAARIERKGKAPVDIVGRLDRLSETGDEIWIADFKTGAPQKELPDVYVGQLALYRAAAQMLYPGRKVRAFVLWTAAPRLHEARADELDSALARI